MHPAITKFAFAAALVAGLQLAPSEASAHPWGRHKVGLGLTFYEPTGLTADFRLSSSQSLDLTVGLHTFDSRNNGYVHLQYLVRPFELSHTSSLAIPVYLGIGPYLYGHDRRFDDHVHLGVRVPFGIAFEFRPPIQLFLELAIRAPLVEFNHDEGHGHGTDLGGALGFRLYF